jgi:outer membrane protein OmpA-like peptidoglycan-associated protein
MQNLKYILLSVFMAIACILSAQDYSTKETVSKKVLKCYDKAQIYNHAEQFPKAIEQLNKTLEKDPFFIDAKILRASLYGVTGQLELAAKEFEAVTQLAPDYMPRVWYELAITEMDLQWYEKAAGHFETYLESDAKSKVRRQKAERHLVNAQFAAEAITNPVPFDPINLGSAINTESQEYLPSLTADGTRLVFTARVGNQEDFYYSEIQDHEWQPRQPLSKINTPQNEGAQCISADGRLLIFTRCDSRAGMGGCDLYFSAYEYGEWSEPKKIPGNINTAAWEGQPSLSANRQTLYFASDRNGSIGQRDLWKSQWLGNRWGDPINLGPEINTPYNDQCPFIHPDDQTLYFCSDGHPGMGGIDLYFAKKDTSGAFSKPVNLGYPINTPANEGTLSVSINGQMAFFASDKLSSDTNRNSVIAGKASSSLNIDIFEFRLHEAAQPEPVTYLKAKVVDSRSRRGIQVVAEISDVESGETMDIKRSDEKGSFLVCLPAGKDYALHISKEKYLFHSENFSLKDPTSIDEPYLLYIELQPVPEKIITPDSTAQEAIILKNVFFETGSANLKNSSTAELERLAGLLINNPDLKIQINGHTDNVGSETDNLQLSENRAKAVYDFLISKGIEIARLRYKGFGESQPIADNESESGRKMNRRTEFVVW